MCVCVCVTVCVCVCVCVSVTVSERDAASYGSHRWYISVKHPHPIAGGELWGAPCPLPIVRPMPIVPM